MEVKEVFPFEYVKKNSKVIIFGLGRYGKSYIEQIKATQWCQIIGTSDSNPMKRVQEYRFIPAYQLKKISADYIIIAISAIEMVRQVYGDLIEYGIPDSKIISTSVRIEQDYKLMPMKFPTAHKLQILFLFGGGLGDYVVYLSVYERIISFNDDVDIDIKCRKKYGDALYADKPSIRFIFDENEKIDFNLYDLILYIEQGIYILKYVKNRCDNSSYALSEKVRFIQEKDDGLNQYILQMQYRFAIYIRRAIIKGWNVYRALGYGNILELNADMVHIDMSEKYQSVYLELGLGKYVTVNRGADKLPLDNRMQTKVWPYRYYEQLLAMFKSRYPEYEIIQLGDNDAEQISGVNRCIKGQSLELVKYILKNSSLHIDCEGGLVHLATALGTKCVVMFGPTPVEYYGYPQNINITAGGCQNCMSLTNNWYVECLRGEEEPECMYGIMPELVLKKITEYIDHI